MGNIIWTKHAIERNRQRQVKESWVEQTINKPDNFSELDGGKLKLKKNFGRQTVTVVSAKSDSGKYLVLSAWINPPTIGTRDFKNKTSFLKKFWVTFRRQVRL